MSTKVVDPVELPAALIDFIGKWKVKRGNLIMVLHKVQQHYGYVPRKVAMEVARMLDVPLAKIYGVVTFYHFFKLKKP
jgi:NADH-quinone oxidoreductase subunit E